VKGRVLVTDGEQRAALAIVRSLGRAGWEVGVCSARSHALAAASRFARWRARVADPLLEPGRFVDRVAEVVRLRAVDVVVPVSEAALLAALPARDRLSPALLPFPAAETFRRMSDKTAVMEAARTVGIRVPRQTVLGSPAEGGQPAEPLQFPVVVKPARSVSESNGRRAKAGVRYAVDPASLRSVLAGLDPAVFPVLLQERVVGPGTGVFVLLWEGELVARFAHRRLREKPPSGGVSVLCESVPLDPALLDRSLALLRCLGADGVAMVEYKLDDSGGPPCLMEINARFWGSLQLAIDAGVDFPALLLDAATDRHPAPVTGYRVGVRSRWGWGDVDHLLARWRRSAAELALPPGAPGRWATLCGFLGGFGPGTRSDVFRADDPGPFARETLEWLRGR
jgi:predicted ATP-grasp superfamily ATP-dependent carboligase